jgi:hypothetical protein
METADVRKRIKETIDRARRAASDRRARNAEAERAFEPFLETLVVPLFHQVAGVLKSEGYPFTVQTPAGTARLSSERSREDFIELRLDTTGPRPQVVARIERARGRETIVEDRPLKPGALVEHLTEQDVLDLVTEGLAVFVEK